MRRSPHSVDDQNAGEHRYIGYYVGGPRRRPGKAEKGIFRLQRILFEGHAEGRCAGPDEKEQARRAETHAQAFEEIWLSLCFLHFGFQTPSFLS
jgi:hypothetical protein